MEAAVAAVAQQQTRLLVRSVALLAVAAAVGRRTVRGTQHVRTVLRFVPAEHALVESAAEDVEAALAIAMGTVDDPALACFAKGADALKGGGIRVVFVRLVVVVHVHSRHVGDAGDVTPLRLDTTRKDNLLGVVAVLFHCAQRTNRTELAPDHQQQDVRLPRRLLQLLLAQVAHKCPSRTFI